MSSPSLPLNKQTSLLSTSRPTRGPRRRTGSVSSRSTPWSGAKPCHHNDRGRGPTLCPRSTPLPQVPSKAPPRSDPSTSFPETPSPGTLPRPGLVRPTLTPGPLGIPTVPSGHPVVCPSVPRRSVQSGPVGTLSQSLLDHPTKPPPLTSDSRHPSRTPRLPCFTPPLSKTPVQEQGQRSPTLPGTDLDRTPQTREDGPRQ